MLSIQNPQVSFAASLEARRARLAALDPERLRVVRHDIPALVATVLGTLPALRALRADVASKAGEPFGVLIDGLQITAEAAYEAHSEHQLESAPTSSAELAEVARPLREMLLTDVRSMVNRGHMPAAVLGNLVGAQGFKNLASDLLLLVRGMRKHWADVSEITPVTEVELAHAENVAHQLVRESGERELVAGASAAADLRMRAYTLLLGEYDQVRRAVSFVRWDLGDVDRIVPSLFAGRGGRGRSEEPASPVDDEDDDQLPPNGVTPMPMNGGPPFTE